MRFNEKWGSNKMSVVHLVSNKFISISFFIDTDELVQYFVMELPGNIFCCYSVSLIHILCSVLDS